MSLKTNVCVSALIPGVLIQCFKEKVIPFKQSFSQSCFI